MKKTDILIFISALILFSLAVAFNYLNRTEGGMVSVTVDGSEIAVYPLDEQQTVMITGADGGENVLQISDHSARILSADCPDGSCVHQKPIRANGETIVCLPHRVVIEIRSSKESEVDAVAR